MKGKTKHSGKHRRVYPFQQTRKGVRPAPALAYRSSDIIAAAGKPGAIPEVIAMRLAGYRHCTRSSFKTRWGGGGWSWSHNGDRECRRRRKQMKTGEFADE
jgi:hypothetical protein